MTDTSPKLSVPPDRPVDPLLLDILRRVDAVAREQDIDYFIGGALARDLILQHVFGKDTGRATRDVDFGICIDDWGKLDSLKASLIQGGNFSEQPKFAHRLIYLPREDAFGIPLICCRSVGLKVPTQLLPGHPAWMSYLQLASDAFKTVVDEDAAETIVWRRAGPDGQEYEKQARLPRVIFVR